MVNLKKSEEENIYILENARRESVSNVRKTVANTQTDTQVGTSKLFIFTFTEMKQSRHS